MRISDWSSDVCSSDLHFMFVGNKGKSGRNDAQHRRNLKAGVGAEAIRYTNNVDLIARHGEFLFGLTQGSVGHILVSVVHPAAGKGYLSCMFASMSRALGPD